MYCFLKPSLSSVFFCMFLHKVYISVLYHSTVAPCEHKNVLIILLLYTCVKMNYTVNNHRCHWMVQVQKKSIDDVIGRCVLIRKELPNLAVRYGSTIKTHKTKQSLLCGAAMTG